MTSPAAPPPRGFRAGKNTRNSTAPARKKACNACSVAKVRCDLVKPSCSRCNARSLQCRYAQATKDDQRGTHWQTSVTSPTNYPATTTSVHAFEETNAFSSRRAASPVPTSLPEVPPYPSVTEPEAYYPPENDIDFLHPTELTAPDTDEDALMETRRAPHPATHGPLDLTKGRQSPGGIDLAAPTLVCTVDASRVRDRWFREFEPPADQQPKVYTPGVLHFVSRVMESFPRMMATGEITALPPIIHPAQMRAKPVPTALVNCITLTRMWETRVPGGEAIIRATIITEMERLLQEVRLIPISFPPREYTNPGMHDPQRRSYDQLNLLAAFQAYLLYTIMLFFPAYAPSRRGTSHDSPVDVDEPSQIATRMTMINLQEIAHDLTLTGLICPEELQGQDPTLNPGVSPIPDLSSWILATAKRRTLVAMYILDSTYCNISNLQWFNADEIGNLPAPACKTLWNASVRCSSGEVNISDADAQWRREYKRYLGQWEAPDGRTRLLRIEEFWPDKVRPGGNGELDRERRVGGWIGDLDEFGMMFFAVTGVTYFC